MCVCSCLCVRPAMIKRRQRHGVPICRSRVRLFLSPINLPTRRPFIGCDSACENEKISDEQNALVPHRSDGPVENSPKLGDNSSVQLVRISTWAN